MKIYLQIFKLSFNLKGSFIMLTLLLYSSFLYAAIPVIVTKSKQTYVAGSNELTYIYLLIRSTAPIPVKGKVVDEKGQPLIGVSIVLKGTNIGTATDIDGNYNLNLPDAMGTLVFKYIGYNTLEFPIGNRTLINVTLVAATKSLNEVVVVGYGTQKKSSITSAVSGISANQIEDRPIARIDQALAAQVSGVQVKAVTGTPGQPLQIRVRGGNSISASNEPLYVVDGIPVTDLGSINPDDIESINVLKDAASAAIYGSRGSNGVVLVTSKKGKNGPAKIQFSTYFGIQKPEKLVKMLDFNGWVDLNKEVEDINWESYGKTLGKNFQRGDSQASRVAQLKLLNPTLTTIKPTNFPTYLYDPRWAYGTDSLDYIDWQREMFKAAPMQSYQLSASGGSDNVTYLVSGEYFNQKGLVTTSGYERFSFRSNIEAKLNNRLKVGLNLNPSSAVTEGALFDGRNSIGQPAGINPVGEKGQLINEGVGSTPTYAWASTSEVSPITQYSRTLNETSRTRILSNIYTNLNIIKGLNLNVTGGWNFDSNNNKYYQPTEVTARNIGKLPGSASTGGQYNSLSQYGLFQTVLSYDLHYKEHDLNAIAGYSAEGTHTYQTNQTNSVFPNDNLQNLDFASSTTTVSNTQEFKNTLLSYFSRLQYSFKNRYLLSASIRRDGFSKFGSNNKYGYFPAASIGWNVSDEEFWLPLSRVVSNFKPRVSYGVVGNNSFSSNYPTYGSVTSTNYSYNGSKVIGYSPTTIGNDNLRWEKTTSTNVGMDLGFLKNRINLSLEYYYKNTKDLLLGVPVALVTGYATQLENIGSVTNKGLEIDLNTKNFTGKFKWETSFNISWNKNKVTKLGSNNTPIFTGFGNTAEIAVGQP
ncbi:MAG: SusC/RagA family TonB-linked outer membrane protein, partial [Sphingobacteriaceae bacterium]